MAYASTNAPLSKSASAGFATGLLAALREAAQRYRVYRTTISELSALTNMELADLGINRSMIKRLALDAAYGEAA